MSCCTPTATIATPAATITVASSSTGVSGNIKEIHEFPRNSKVSLIFQNFSEIHEFPDTPVDELAAVIVAAGVAIVAVGVQRDTNIQARVRISQKFT